MVKIREIREYWIIEIKFRCFKDFFINVEFSKKVSEELNKAFFQDAFQKNLWFLESKYFCLKSNIHDKISVSFPRSTYCEIFSEEMFGTQLIFHRTSKQNLEISTEKTPNIFMKYSQLSNIDESFQRRNIQFLVHQIPNTSKESNELGENKNWYYLDRRLRNNIHFII